MNGTPKTVLVTGATGYIGGRLVPRLLEAGHTVKVVVRTPAKIAGVPWLEQVEVVPGSLDDGDVLRAALDGVDVLYYLVHSMAAGAGFEAKEKTMAGPPQRPQPTPAWRESSISAACTRKAPNSQRTCGPGKPSARSSSRVRWTRSCSRPAS